MDSEQPTHLKAGAPNAIGRTLGLLGDEWTLLLIQQAFLGATRYGQFKAALPISNAVLTARLGKLTKEGLLERHIYQSSPLRAEYLLTPRSRSLWPALLTIWDWERHWVPAHAATLPRMVHTECSQEFTPVLSCGACTRPVAARDMDGVWGPSGSWERSVPTASTRRRWDSDQTPGQAGMFPETMAILGNRWSSALIGAAFRGVTRFADFERTLGAPPALVADRIKAFAATGVLEATRTETRPGWAEYRLTEKGRAFYPVIATTLHWGHSWFLAPEGPAFIQTHRSCSSVFVPELRCDRCGKALHRRTIQISPTAAGP
ncbi:winged helix-turn-helix transcriptional regulator [Streptomyces sp. 3214.6]|uniref:winged helix-turn-helix transcriptional regulator n=1 Tax=Streptomyces sp. 3214.6 TaxID=1882757 RepID=UPI00090CB2A6|nr:helix-turn-helix domain-containing protein [Streptomyces sp. 3214.6]SHI26091.1 transcriptional regulator, HxlR family [Streptomyces sp. 3214.6]